MAESSVSQVWVGRLPSQLQRHWQQTFQVRVRGISPAERCFVSVDIGKYEHVALVCDGNGQPLAAPLRFGIRQADYQRFFAWVDQLAMAAAAKPWFGMEPTGHYYETLAHEIVTRYGSEQLFLVQSTDVARRRGDWNQDTYKDDSVDACVINHLLRDGQGRPYRPAVGPYLALYQLERQRLAGERFSSRLKNQILGHVDRLYPGLVIRDADLARRYKPLFTDLWHNTTPRQLLQLFPDPRQLRSQTADSLFAAFHAAGQWMTHPYAQKIISAVQALCLPEAILACQRSQFLLADLASLAHIQSQLAQTEAQMAQYLDQTWGRWLRPTKVDSVRLACLVAVVGDMGQYASAGQLWARSGLHPRCRDSGLRQRRGQGERMVRPGDRHLRRQLLRFTLCMLSRYPALRLYKLDLLLRGKHVVVADIAVARRLCGMLFAVATKEQPFDPFRFA